MSLEDNIKNTLSTILKKSIKSKETVATIILDEKQTKQEKENVEIDIELFKKNIQSEFNNIKKLFTDNGIDVSTLKYKPECFNFNYVEFNEIINKVYECQFKNQILKNKKNWIGYFMIKHWKKLASLIIILIIIAVIVKIRKSNN